MSRVLPCLPGKNGERKKALKASRDLQRVQVNARIMCVDASVQAVSNLSHFFRPCTDFKSILGRF